MSPQSLVFSSDEETSRRLARALHELELEVDYCPEIFGAVEKITGQSFDLIAVDWDDEPEASFLLKTASELQTSQGAFAIAIASPRDSLAAYQAGAKIVLRKPVVPDQAKYDLLTCDAFLSCLQNWLPRMGYSAAASAPPPARQTPAAMPAPGVRTLVEPVAANPPAPSPSLPEESTVALPVHLTFATLDGGLFRHRAKTIPAAQRLAPSRKTRFHRLLWGAGLAAASLSVGYVFSQPLPAARVVAMAKVCGRALQKTNDWLRGNDDDRDPEIIAVQDPGQGSLHPKPAVRKAHVLPAVEVAAITPPETTKDLTAVPAGTATADSTAALPESIRTPFPVAAEALHAVTSRIGPTLLSALEPVNLPEDLADKLLQEKVQPSYPEKALKAGLQGSVVLEAWIGRDGKIHDLKMIRGSLLLGQAACNAVKQWRYKPYFLNGHAVDAQTYVTVDFKLPQS